MSTPGLVSDVVASKPQALSLFAYPIRGEMSQSTLASAPATPTMVPSKAIHTEVTPSSQPYGAAAWERSTDSLGNPCVSWREVESLSANELSKKIQSGDTKNTCGYRSQLLQREDARPDDILSLGDDVVFRGFYVVVYGRNGFWSVSDLEKLATRKLDAKAALNLYILLKVRGSGEAWRLAERRDQFIDREALEHLLNKGECPGGEQVWPCSPELLQLLH